MARDTVVSIGERKGGLCHAQVVLAPKTGGLLFVSNATYFHKPFPWTARLLAVGAVTAQPLAVVTKPGQQQGSWLHMITAEIHEHSSTCASRLLPPHSMHSWLLLRDTRLGLASDRTLFSTLLPLAQRECQCLCAGKPRSVRVSSWMTCKHLRLIQIQLRHGLCTVLQLQ